MSAISIITCPREDCSHVFKAMHPGKMGRFPLSCPKCKRRMTVEVTGMNAEDMRAVGVWPDPTVKAETAKKAAIELKDTFYTGIQYSVDCPHCNNAKLPFKTDMPGSGTLTCPECGGIATVEVRKKTVIINPTTAVKPLGIIMVPKKSFFINRMQEYPLKPGRYIMGRADADAMPDIPIHGDKTVSRRSVEITSTYAADGYSYKIKVLKSTNPVLLNGMTLTEGSVMALNIGDVIQMGSTMIRFTKAKINH